MTRPTLQRFVIPCTVGGQSVRIAVVAESEKAARAKAEKIAADMASRTDARGLLHREAAR